jgi:hypothetical protein
MLIVKLPKTSVYQSAATNGKRNASIGSNVVLKWMRNGDDSVIMGITSQACSIERESDRETNIMNVGSCR